MFAANAEADTPKVTLVIQIDEGHNQIKSIQWNLSNTSISAVGLVSIDFFNGTASSMAHHSFHILFRYC